LELFSAVDVFLGAAIFMGEFGDRVLSAQISGEDAVSSEALLENAIFGLDRWLRRRQGVYEYSSNSKCLFRVNRAEAEIAVDLSDGTQIRPGDAILNLHLLNEHVRRMRQGDSTLGWASHMTRAVDASLRELAGCLARRREFDDIVALRADMRLGTSAQCPQLTRIATHLGFQAANGQVGSRYLRQFGENLFMLLLVMAANPVSLRTDVLWRDHALFYLSRMALERRYRALR
jgi:YkoP domain